MLLSEIAPGSLLPRGVALCEQDLRDPPLPLFEVEQAAIRRASQPRRMEFQAGRTCARRALAKLDHPPAAIPVGADRAPVWPIGIVGSISHCGARCMAAVGRKSAALTAIGIDIERLGAVEPALADEICVSEELSWLAPLPAQHRPMALTTIFSAKEATYKCLYGLTGLVFGFDAIRIEADFARGVFRAIVLKNVPPFAAGRILHGRVGLSGDHIVSAMTLPQMSAMSERSERDLVGEKLDQWQDRAGIAAP